MIGQPRLVVEHRPLTDPPTMEIILANPRGFCAGVHMAIDVVDQVLDLYPGQTIYVFHEIVHNKHVVGRFKDRGVVFVESLNEVPEGEIVIFSAHGVSPMVRQRAQNRGLIAIDATCPLVTKVHSEAIRYARQGYQILLVGHSRHQEVVGTRGEAPNAIKVVESVHDAQTIQVKDDTKLVYLTQTTLSTDDAYAIISELKKRFPKIKEPPGSDICYATTNRQHAVRQIAKQCDLVLVVGSDNSSNSVRLTEIAQHAGTPGYLVDDVSEIDPNWFKGASRVLLTAGASAPEDLVAEICKALIDRFQCKLIDWDFIDEDVEFALPGTLKKIMREQGINTTDRKIRVGKPQITQDLYGTTPITISAQAPSFC